MAAGHAQRIYDEDPSLGPVAICDLKGNALSHELWAGNPIIAPPVPGFPNKVKPGTRTVQNAKGCRPYIQYPFTDLRGWNFSKDWKARDHRGQIYFTAEELALAADVKREFGDFILMEPSPIRGCKNRAYPLDRWQTIALRLSTLGVPLLQLDHPAAHLLPYTIPVKHRGFRQACAVLAVAGLFVATEGGLAHAAAAVKTPAVVLWGGCISADVLGYPEHVNLVDDGPGTPCGRMDPCPHCAAAWDRLTPERVVTAVQTAWEQR